MFYNLLIPFLSDKNFVSVYNCFMKNNYFEQIKSAFMYGFTGKQGNIIDFAWHKDMKMINKISNSNAVNIVIIALCLIICLCILYR